MIIFLFCIFAVFLQLSVVGVFFSEYRIPDLALALVIALTVAMGFKKSIGWLVLTGFLIDAGSGSVFGTAALAYILIGWGISYLLGMADIRSRKILFLSSLAVFAVFSEIAKDWLVLAGLKIKASYLRETLNASGGFFSPDYILKIFYTILAVYFIYYVFRKISRKLFLKPVYFSKAKP